MITRILIIAFGIILGLTLFIHGPALIGMLSNCMNEIWHSSQGPVYTIQAIGAAFIWGLYGIHKWIDSQ